MALSAVATEHPAERIDPSVVARIVELNHLYAQCLDDNRLDDWPRFFVDDCRYIVQTRENMALGLEGYLLYFDNKRMLNDRVLSLKEVNIYNIHYDRHFLSGAVVTGQSGGVYTARANYMVVQTTLEGRSSIFSVGEYRDQIVLVDGQPRFKEKFVVVDTYMVNSLLAIPL
jgi:anthranilate 1,2-dioxygenase small subunit